MFLLIILPILVSGFIVCNLHFKHYFKLHRYEGQHLYLLSAQQGTICFIFFFSIALMYNESQFTNIDFITFIMGYLDQVAPPATSNKHIYDMAGLAPPPPNENDLRLAAWIALTAVGSIVTAVLWCITYFIWLYLKGAWILSTPDTDPKAENIWSLLIQLIKRWVIQYIDFFKNLITHPIKSFYTGKIALIHQIVSDNLFDKLLIDAWIEETLVRLTLDSRKVYICNITDIGLPNESEGISTQNIAIIPSFGGYRDEKKLLIHPTTLADGYEGMRVKIIKKDEIVAMSAFHADEGDIAKEWKKTSTSVNNLLGMSD